MLLIEVQNKLLYIGCFPIEESSNQITNLSVNIFTIVWYTLWILTELSCFIFFFSFFLCLSKIPGQIKWWLMVSLPLIEFWTRYINFLKGTK